MTIIDIDALTDEQKAKIAADFQLQKKQKKKKKQPTKNCLKV